MRAIIKNMQIFELHFNPKSKEEHIFDSFVYEPENIYEKKLGSLYMAGGLQNILPKDIKFLDNIAGVIKKNYYTLSAQNPEKAFSYCLKKTNEYLDQEIKKNNVGWLGNLSFAVVSLKNLNLICAKTGKIKILLSRNNKIIDIGKNLDLKEIDPYPLKVFLNVISGKLTEDDLILIMTEGIFEFFQQENILTKIVQAEKIDSKKIKEILPEKIKVEGVCFLAKTGLESEKIKKILPVFSQNKKWLSWLKIPKIKIPGIKIPGLLKIKKPSFPKIKFRLADSARKKLILILALIFLLALGFLLFSKP